MSSPLSVCDECLVPHALLDLVFFPSTSPCAFCGSGYTAARWKPSTGGQRKRTIACVPCAQAREACQCCLRHRTLGIAIHLADRAAELAGARREELAGLHSANEKNRAHHRHLLLTRQHVAGTLSHDALTNTLGTALLEDATTATDRAARPTCSLARRGLCTRGDSCPFRHPGESATTTATTTAAENGSTDDSESHNLQRIVALDVPPAVTEEDLAEHLHVAKSDVQRRGPSIFISFPTFEAATAAVARYTDNSIVRLSTGQHFRVEFVRRGAAAPSGRSGAAATAAARGGKEAGTQGGGGTKEVRSVDLVGGKRGREEGEEGGGGGGVGVVKENRFWSIAEYTR